MAVVDIRVEANVTAGWVDITTDVDGDVAQSVDYGIDGNRPLDVVASTGEFAFTLLNDPPGRYSMKHDDRLAGWARGTPMRVRAIHGADLADAVDTITRAGSTATVEMVANHALNDGDWVEVVGADQSEYNGLFQVSTLGLPADTFEYEVTGTPASPASGTVTAQRFYYMHRGKVYRATPTAGLARDRRVAVVSHDAMRDLAEADVREIDVQIDQSEDDLIDAALDAIPAAMQPIARDLDAGVDTMPVAFHDIGPGVKCMTLVHDIVVASFGLAFVKADGTFRYVSRTTRATGSSEYSFTSLNCSHVDSPTDQDDIFNLIRLRIRPATVDATASTVLWAAEGDPIEIPAGGTYQARIEFRDPDNRQNTLIGGDDVVTPVQGTDYAANSASGGGGADLSGDLSVTFNDFAAGGEWVIVNNASVTAYLVNSSGVPLLQVRGKGIYDRNPQTFEAGTGGMIVRPITIDLRYNSNPFFAKSYADYLDSQYSSDESQIGMLEFWGNVDDAQLRAALSLEPGAIVDLSEELTGLDAVDAVVHRKSTSIEPGNLLVCRLSLSPAAPFRSWLAGVVTRSEAGQTTVVGF